MPSRARPRAKPSPAADALALEPPACLMVIDQPNKVPGLVETLFDTARYLPLVLTSTASDTGRPRLDLSSLIERVGEHVNVVVLCDQTVARTFSDLAPEGFRTYGGGTRLVWPNAGRDDPASAHPLFLTATEDKSEVTIGRIVSALTRAGHMAPTATDTNDVAGTKTLWDQPSPTARRTTVKSDPTQVLRAELATATERASTLATENAALRKTVRSLADQVTGLEERLHHRAVYADPARQLEHEIQLAWLTTYTEHDRQVYPLATYRFGADFVASVETIAGIERDKIVAACVDVLTRRAFEVNGRKARQMRTSEEGGAPVRVRVHDAAVAWRCNLQTNTASARRMMWWQLPDGTIELAVVALHDDVGFR